MIKAWYEKIKQKIKSSITKVFNARGSVHEIALGAAIGAFWAVFPTFGLGTVLTIGLYKILRFNLLVAFSAAIISNPFTSPFWLYSSYKVGAIVLKPEVEFQLETWKENISEIGYTMLLGSVIVSGFTAAVIYFITKYVIHYRRRLKSAASKSN